MADSGESRVVFVETSIDTRLGLLLDSDDSVSAFREKICKEHEQCFPSVGSITVSALKVKYGGQFYHVADLMILNNVFQSISDNHSFLFVDVLRVEEKGIMLTGKASFSNPKLLEIETNDMTVKEAPVTQAGDKKSRKRKHKTSDSAHANQSRKKRSLGDQSSGKGEVPTGTIGKDLEEGEKSAATVDQEKDLALVDDENESHKDDVCLGAIVQDFNQCADVENEGLNKDGGDGTWESLPNQRGDKPVTNILVLMAPAVPNKKDNGGKDADEATTSVKVAKKGRAKKDKQENVEKVVSSSKKSRKKQSSEEA